MIGIISTKQPFAFNALLTCLASRKLPELASYLLPAFCEGGRTSLPQRGTLVGNELGRPAAWQRKPEMEASEPLEKQERRTTITRASCINTQLEMRAT